MKHIILALLLVLFCSDAHAATALITCNGSQYLQSNATTQAYGCGTPAGGGGGSVSVTAVDSTHIVVNPSPGTGTFTLDIGTAVATASKALNFFSATTSAQLASVISDETGTGVLVFNASPTFTGTISAAAASFSGTLAAGNTNFSGSMTNFGTMSIGTTASAASGTILDLSASPNSLLLPSGTTGQRPTGINGMLRYNTTTSTVEAYINNAWTAIPGSGSSLTVGTTTISGGTNGRIEFNNSGVLGEYNFTGTGSVAMSTQPVFVTSINLGAANLITDTTTGTKIGTATSQKLGFFNATPIIQPTGNICTAMTGLGLVSSCTESGGGGTVTSSGSPVSGNVAAFSTATNIVPATAANIVSLFSTCSGTQYLGADGACHTASGGGTVTFGTSTAATNPQISGDATSGFYTPIGTTVAVAAGGVTVEQWNTLASGVDYLSITAGTSTAPPSIAVAGATTNQSLNLTSKGTGAVNITGANTGLEITSVNALRFPTSDSGAASSSIAIGSSALVGQTSSAAYSNVAVGYQVLSGTMTTAATGNTAVGYQAAKIITSASDTTAFGYQALLGQTNFGPNTAIGYQALKSCISGCSNTAAVGDSALSSMTNQGGGTCVGSSCGKNLTGATNTGLGSSALCSVTSGTNNIGIGGSALGNCGNGNSGSQNTVVGTNSLSGTTGASSNNTTLGYNTLHANTTGNTNTVIGANVGSTTLTSGTGNILIGTQSGVDTQTASSSNTLNIGNMIYGIGLSTSGTTPTGQVGIGTATPNTGVHLDLGSTTDSMLLPIGTTGQRPATGINGMLRYNSTTPTVEAYVNNAWTALGSGGGSGTVNSGTTPNLAYYATTTTAVSQTPNLQYLSTGLGILGVNGITYPPNDNIITNASIAIGSSALSTQASAGAADYENIAIGAQTLSAAGFTSANFYEIAIGAQAMKSMTTGHGNVAIGQQAMMSGTSAEDDIALGYQSMLNVTTGQFNEGLGLYSLTSIGTGNQNIGVGFATLRYAVGNNDNIGIGYTALQGVSVGTTMTGSDNIAIGNASAPNITTGNQNVFVGSQTGNTVSTGQGYVVMGYQAAFNCNGTGTTVAIGFGADESSNCAQDVVIGYDAGTNETNASGNTMIGYETGLILQSGSNNTMIGNSVGSATITTGANNIFIGVSSAVPSTIATNTSNTIQIGGTGGDWFNITGTGTLATEVATMRGLLVLTDLPSDAGVTDDTVCARTSDNRLFKGSGTLGICLGTSSARFKKDIQPIVYGLAEIEDLKPVTFHFNNEKYGNINKEQVGFIAEDAVKVVPKLVGLDNEGRPNTVDYLGIVPILVKGMQEQQQEIKQLEAQIIDMGGKPIIIPVNDNVWETIRHAVGMK